MSMPQFLNDPVQSYFSRTNDAALIREAERVSKCQPETRFTVMAFVGIVLCVNPREKATRKVDLSRDELLKMIDTELRVRAL